MGKNGMYMQLVMILKAINSFDNIRSNSGIRNEEISAWSSGIYGSGFIFNNKADGKKAGTKTIDVLWMYTDIPTAFDSIARDVVRQ